jgi:LacI family transcriptional regulator
MLDEVMSGELSGPPFVREFPVVRIVRRQSTRKFDACAGLIKRALEYIRLNACNGAGAAEVAAEVGCARRTLERNFKLATGRTLLDAVHEVRIERAQDLLRDKSVPIKVIYGQCGYADDMAFRRFFRKRTGVSPLAWRSQC